MLTKITKTRSTSWRRPIELLLLQLLVLSFGVVLAAPADSKDLEVVESRYNTIIIRERAPYISMRFGYNTKLYTESIYNPEDRLELPAQYAQKMTVGLAYTNSVADILEIGSGGGRIASYLSSTLRGSTQITTVELDPEVIRLSRKYFDLEERSNLRIEVSDGRLYLLRNKRKYDVIFVDAYRGPFVPFHLLTQEFYRLALERLKTGGVLVQNVEPSTMLFDAAISTIGTVFDNVDIYRAGKNVIVVAYNGAEKPSSEIAQRAAQIDRDFSPRYRYRRMIRGRKIIDKARVTAEPLSDDFAPAQYLRSIENHNRRYDDITK